MATPARTSGQVMAAKSELETVNQAVNPEVGDRQYSFDVSGKGLGFG